MKNDRLYDSPLSRSNRAVEVKNAQLAFGIRAGLRSAVIFFQKAIVTTLAAACGFISLGAEAGSVRSWNDYRTIMWIGDSAYKKPEKIPLFFARLREMGINTAMAYGSADPKTLAENNFPYYVENIVNRGLCLKFNSKVTDWDKFITEWNRTGRAESGLVRDYCLNDPKWLASASEQMKEVAKKNLSNQPLAFDIRDELSTTISANPFDYDFNPIALDAFRAWLKIQYKSLDALNEEWDTTFASWSAVRPFTTDQIKNRMVSGASHPEGQPDWHAVQAIQFEPQAARQQPTRWNFAPWADFRTFMDLSLAHSLNELRGAAHEVDPATPVGIEGTQMPSAFGGYDLWLLSQSLDWIEPYDIGNAREILGSFMLRKPMLTTVFEKDSEHARRRLWHLLLEGDRGCVVWWSEDCIDWNSPDYALTGKGKALKPVLKELSSPLGLLFLRAERERDPIAIHYSQPSIQADWLIESTPDGSTWLRRFSSFEADHNHFARVRNGMLKAIQDVGYRPEFISTAQITSGELTNRNFRALVLPESLSLSAREITQIDSFHQNGGTVLGTARVGLFDEHCKLRTNVLDRAWTTNTVTEELIERYALDRLHPEPFFEEPRWIKKQLASIKQTVSVPIESRTLIHRFKIGNGRLLALERNINYQMSEDLAQAGGNENLEKPADVEVTLSEAAHVYDLRRNVYVGRVNHFTARIDPWQPALYALLKEKVKLASWLEAAINLAE
jgi:hypothetical protein